MSQIYLNGPSVGRAMSAEEFTRAAGRLPDRSFAQGANDGPRQAGRLPGQSFAQGVNDGAGTCQGPSQPGCGCGCCGGVTPPAGCGCGCSCWDPMPPMGGGVPGTPPDGIGPDGGYCQPMICCCQPAPGPGPGPGPGLGPGAGPGPFPQPPQVDEGCCCKQSFCAALRLLSDPQIAPLLDFDLAAFVTDTYSAGVATAAITAPTPGAAPAPVDNLGTTLAGRFLRFAPCSCDLLDISAALYNQAGTAVNFTATQLSVCQLDAVVIQGAAGVAEGDLSDDEVTARNFRYLSALLAQRINPPCGQQTCPCTCACACDDQECCCAPGLLNTLAQNNLSRRVSLTAGLLVLLNVTLLGTVGNVLVLANDANNRLYFVCVNSVQFIG